jgi:16S rRNA (cytosine1402-N4)-methyltransferase
MSNQFHVPVLREEVSRYLINDKMGIYVDGTLGGGGHAEYLLNILHAKANYIGIDQDAEAIRFAQKRLSGFRNVQFQHANFRHTHSVLKNLKISQVHGFFLDLGISSYQINNPKRGFTYMSDSPLDMRMNMQDNSTAAELVNTLSETELKRLFWEYGEERFAAVIARRIIEYRKKDKIQFSRDLRNIIDRVVRKNQAIKSYARIFQALRIAVNEELNSLQSTLDGCISFLGSGARLVVIAYHSLEDRIVKQFLKKQENPCECPHEFPQCICGKVQRLKILTRRPIRPADIEIETNPRARSAVLRAGEIL